MTSTVGLAHYDQALRQILKADTDAFCSRPEIIGLGHLGWEQVHPITSSHDQPTKHSGQDLAMELVLGMATSGRRVVLLEVG